MGNEGAERKDDGWEGGKAGGGDRSKHPHQKREKRNIFLGSSEQCHSSEPHDLNKTDLAACSNEEQSDKATLEP